MRSYLVRDSQRESAAAKLLKEEQLAGAIASEGEQEGNFRNFFVPLSAIVQDVLKDVEFDNNGDLGEWRSVMQRARRTRQ